jgi:hypothetical protein
VLLERRELVDTGSDRNRASGNIPVRPGNGPCAACWPGRALSRPWSHDRAHSFFSRARWNPDELGLAVAKLVVALMVPAGEPVTVAIDDTLFRRRGKQV